MMVMVTGKLKNTEKVGEFAVDKQNFLQVGLDCGICDNFITF